MRQLVLALRFYGFVALGLWTAAFAGTCTQAGEPFAGFRYGWIQTVSLWNESDWGGIKAGLRTHDRIIAVDDVPVRQAADIERAVAAVPAGTPLTYTFQRGAETGRVTVPTTVLGWPDLAASHLLMLAIGLIFILIGFVSFWLQPHSAAVQAHLSLTVATGLFLAMATDNDAARLFPVEFYSTTSLLLGPAFVHLALTFPTPVRWLTGRVGLVYLVYLPVVVLEILIAGVETAAPRYLLASATEALGLLAFVGRLGWEARKSPLALERLQSRLVLLGIVLGAGPLLVAYELPVLFGELLRLSSPLIKLATAATVLFPLVVAYTIARHRLFAIETLLRRTVTYALTVSALTAAYFVSAAGLRTLLADLALVSDAAATAVVALLFVPVRDRLQRSIDRLFYRAGYDAQVSTARFAEVARRVRELPTLTHAFAQEIEAALHPHTLLVLGGNPTEGLRVMHTLGNAANDAPYAPCAGMSRALGNHAAVSHVEVAEVGRSLCLPLLAKDELLGAVVVGPKKSGLEYSQEDMAFLVGLSQLLAVALQNAQLFAQLERRNAELRSLVQLYESANQEAMTDSLSGLYNRRAMLLHLERCIAEARRFLRPLSVILLDIDHFKAVNDVHGHRMGDEVIVSVSQAIRETVRDADAAARWGGEEFLILLPDTNLEGAVRLGERLRERVANQRAAAPAGDLLPAVTISLGVAELQGKQDGSELIDRADRALYTAKAKGRNQTQVFTATPTYF